MASDHVPNFGPDPENMVCMAQLQDHWTYGLEASTSTHTAALQLPKTGNTAQSLHLPAPRLQDLLNPAPLDGSDNPNFEPTFMFKDPYGASLLDDDNDSDTEGDEPTITRASLVKRLEIKNVVNLASKKLLPRYDNALEPKLLHSHPNPLPRRQSLVSNGQRRTGRQRLLTSDHE